MRCADSTTHQLHFITTIVRRVKIAFRIKTTVCAIIGCVKRTDRIGKTINLTINYENWMSWANDFVAAFVCILRGIN